MLAQKAAFYTKDGNSVQLYPAEITREGFKDIMWHPKLDFGKLGKTNTLPSIFLIRFPMSPVVRTLDLFLVRKLECSGVTHVN